MEERNGIVCKKEETRQMQAQPPYGTYDSNLHASAHTGDEQNIVADRHRLPFL